MSLFYPPFRIGGGTSIAKDEVILKVKDVWDAMKKELTTPIANFQTASIYVSGTIVSFETGAAFESGSIESFTTSTA